MLNYEEELVATGMGRILNFLSPILATEIWEPNNEWVYSDKFKLREFCRNPDFYDKIASFEGTASVSTQDQNYYVDSSGQNPIARFRRFDYDK